jgi:hypothetical protein
MNIQMAINKLQEQLVILIRPVVEVSVNAAKCTGHYAYEGGKCVLKSAAAAGVTVVGAAVLAGKGVGHISVEGAKRFGHGVRFAVDKTAAGLVEAKDYTVDAAVKTGRAVGRSAKHVYQSVENLIDRFARSLIRHAAQNSRIRQENQRYTVPHGSE